MDFEETGSLDSNLIDIESNMYVDYRTIIKKIDKTFDDSYLKKNKSNFSDQIKLEGRWIFLLTENYVISAYFHPTKTHSATVINGFFIKNKLRVIKEKGKWAISYLPRTLFFNKTYFNILPDE